MKTLKVMSIVGTRPEIIKLSRIIYELERFTQHIFVHTGQNYDYELNEIFLKDLELKKPNYFLECADEKAAHTIGQVIIRTDEVLEIEKPDAVVVYGDTNSCLAVIAVKRRKIPIFHLEAGNRSFDQRIPEEINRKIVDHISDVNLTISSHAKNNLIAEGINPETIFNIGSPMLEIFNYYKEQINSSGILHDLGLSPHSYFLVSIHREENLIENNLHKILNILNIVATHYNKKIIVSTHPRLQKMLAQFKISNPKYIINSLIYFQKPFGFFSYTKLQTEAFCVLSDSGSITEDASVLNIPAVTLREAHERPEGFDVGTLIMSGLNPERVIQSIDIITQQYHHDSKFKMIPDYSVNNVSQKVLRIIISYTDYINRTVWHKEKYSINPV